MSDGCCINCGEYGNWCRCDEEENPSTMTTREQFAEFVELLTVNGTGAATEQWIVNHKTGDKELLELCDLAVRLYQSIRGKPTSQSKIPNLLVVMDEAVGNPNLDKMLEDYHSGRTRYITAPRGSKVTFLPLWPSHECGSGI